ncbi:hypothetical protein NPIL_501861 [Nephila pilipes]|uniref:Uncharacterized protein n=1 Tax=Nephila pilipes TaxID=299642 RepID=A0A8X6QTI8_NEPPI|nr:hypothetical protein NPIL_501861 [Nephila pilipes]
MDHGWGEREVERKEGRKGCSEEGAGGTDERRSGGGKGLSGGAQSGSFVYCDSRYGRTVAVSYGDHDWDGK